MDIEELIERLNQYSQSLIAYQLGAGFADACMDAAAILSTLQAENEKLRAASIMHHNAADNYWHELNEYRQERNEALTELEQVKQERDEAVECINTVYSYILIKSKTDAVRTIEKWLRGQKED